MSFPRQEYVGRIASRLTELATGMKGRSRANLLDGNRFLETIIKRFFNALFCWELVNLNCVRSNYPAADLGDLRERVAIQVTNEDTSTKIKRTATKAAEHQLGDDFDRLIVFFLLAEKPDFPKSFVQPPNGPQIETWDISDILKLTQEAHLNALAKAVRVLDEEMDKSVAPNPERKFDISRIAKYSPTKLIGREVELQLLKDAWEKVQSGDTDRLRVVTFVALGGEGKTSLVAKWAAELAALDWPGCDAAFAWSFYSQGTREQVASSSDLFLKECLDFFGNDADKAFAVSNATAYQKGELLARIVGRQRCLIILDGLEPLQFAPSAATPGQLKDQGVASLLKGLATASQGLCIVTTRFSLPDLRTYFQMTAREETLLRLSSEAGVAVLKDLGVRGREEEFHALAESVKGHALTLTLLGTFLRRAFDGDIRRHECVKFDKADEKIDGGHAFRTMAAYEEWLLRDGGEEGKRQVAVLRIIGLFDRPADVGCLTALRRETILGITEPLDGLADDDWQFCLSGLQEAKLLTVNRDASGALVSLDAHPLLREYFARHLREDHSNGWRAAQRRLFEHLCSITPNNPDSLETLQNLYQAVAHGCRAELFTAALDVFRRRIQRGESFFSVYKMGLVASDLSAVSSFLSPDSRSVVVTLCAKDRVFVLRELGFCLRASGRLIEAIEKYEAALKCLGTMPGEETVKAIVASLLSESLMQKGDVAGAEEAARTSVAAADIAGDLFRRTVCYTQLGTILLHANKIDDCRRVFEEAQNLGRAHPTLVLGNLYRLCEWKLANGESAEVISLLQKSLSADEAHEHWGPFSAGFRFQVLGCAFAKTGDRQAAIKSFSQSIEHFRAAGRHDHVAQPLLQRCFVLESQEEVRSGLDEAWDIAHRVPMMPLLADIHLCRARFFFSKEAYPWADWSLWETNKGGPSRPRTAVDDLAAAEKLITKCGYHRRDGELAHARSIILSG